MQGKTLSSGMDWQDCWNVAAALSPLAFQWREGALLLRCGEGAVFSYEIGKRIPHLSTGAGLPWICVPDPTCSLEWKVCQELLSCREGCGLPQDVIGLPEASAEMDICLGAKTSWISGAAGRRRGPTWQAQSAELPLPLMPGEHEQGETWSPVLT